MNLSKVLDITQEIRDSLIPIVSCNDYSFGVHLGILAGKRDFLNYDVWLKGRIKDIGSPFILPLLKYILDNITSVIKKAEEQNPASVDENFKLQVLERSHLTPEKLSLTLEHLRDLSNRENKKIDDTT
jgi:CCR4-NOT transcription complex subunit 1